jgi:hypothetical protein
MTWNILRAHCGRTGGAGSLLLTTGEAFFARFQQFQGKVMSAELQIRLRRDFFDE